MLSGTISPLPSHSCEVKNYNQGLTRVGGSARREEIYWPHILPNCRPLKVYQVGRKVILKLNGVQILLFLYGMNILIDEMKLLV